jgi:putative membrane protein
MLDITTLSLLLWALAGVLLSAPLACLPGLHIYNVAALALLAGVRWPGVLSGEALAMLLLGLVTGYALLSTLPAVYLTVPDESLVAALLPAQRYLLQRRGYEAVVLTGLGGAGGLAALLVTLPAATPFLRTLDDIVRSHVGWIAAVVATFMLLSEWPRGGEDGRAAARLWDAWQQLLAGLATFALSGLLGLLLAYRSPLPIEAGYQNLLPAFLGLFALPALALNLATRARIPPQHVARTLDVTPALVVRGTAVGVAAGLFGAFFPLVTGGMAGLMASHATAQRDERLFMLSQGACKAVYFVGGYLLFFAPGLRLTRGGAAWLLSTVYVPYRPDFFWLTLAGLALASIAAVALLLPLARMLARVVAGASPVVVSGGTLAALIALVLLVTGPAGLLVAAAATGIGLLPVAWGSRRMNCMGVLLVPMVLNASGAGSAVAAWLGLL